MLGPQDGGHVQELRQGVGGRGGRGIQVHLPLGCRGKPVETPKPIKQGYPEFHNLGKSRAELLFVEDFL